MKSLLLLGLAAALPAPAADPVLPGIGKAMRRFVAAHEISGAVTLVETRQGIVHLEADGLADIAAARPMTPDTLFWVASMTKPVTAAAVLSLQDEGRLNLDDPVAKFIPEFAALRTPSGKPANLTLRRLLTHTSGLGEANGKAASKARTLADMIPLYLAAPMFFEPGARWKYCQSGINTAARVVEIASGRNFADFLAERFFQPLGMKDTTFYPTAEQMTRLALPYRKNTVTGALEPAAIDMLGGRSPMYRDRPAFGNGGLFSTAPDYARFCLMLLNGGSLDGRRYLRPETVRLMDTLQTGDLKAGFTPGCGWGIGVGLVRQPQGVTAMLSPGSFGHGGAYGTQAWIDPSRGVAYVLMIQRTNFIIQNGDNSAERKSFQQAASDALALQEPAPKR